MTRPSRFEGRIGRTLADSEPWFDEPPHPRDGAPDVVVVLLDDTGFAQLGCYGGDVATPSIDSLAADGLQFTDFHVTPLCSPSRAALLTGRAPHAVGMRTVANRVGGFPNQLGHISNHAATMAEVLRDAGYATFCAGKWHLAPIEQCSAAGPFDQWPLGRGFDRFYGFLDGETDQFHPELVADNHPIEPPAGPDDGYHLSEDLVDQLLRMISDSVGVRPDRPFFAYLPFGATHAPHQAPPAHLEKYRGAFDDGWDAARERIFARQLERGLLTEGTVLSPRNPGVERWDDLTDAERALAARLQEAFAAFLDHTDEQLGRLVEGLRRLGRLDNTVLVVLADNGASQEGGAVGVLHEMKWFNGLVEDPVAAQAHLDEIGGPRSHTNYPWGWAQAGNTPFRWYKQNTHEGVHVPMIVHWPAGIDADQRGTLRHQFTFVADIAPTIYEIVGVEPPTTFRGLDQLPVTGHSFASMLTDPDTPAPNTVQIFENAGSRAIVADGWKAVTKHEPGADYETEPWELYDLRRDRSECHDLADAEPGRLRQLVDLWWTEAERHGVLPLDDRTTGLFAARFRDRSPHPTDRRYVYRPPMSPLPSQAAAPIGGRSFDLTAAVDLAPSDEGVLYATGSAGAGISFFVQDGRLVLDYNAFGAHTVLESPDRLASGRHELTVRVRRLDGRAGTATLAVDGADVAHADLPLLMRVISSVGPSVGFDHGSAVSDRYAAPFPFSGDLHEIVIQASPERHADTTAAEDRAGMHRQ
ncbi:sulfatase-like hydrolase/transferase [Actinomarinicola tropica]|uniref:Sulfatase-like hydrolase/transferase n=1 Tax=Actinomarinicola tropica TaxID=2789776 RepID=A0A5Q2RIW2_9ACTN|nr:sulfatase-like hydrolase/transferase [Actinomarinicola tropica]QGG94326.1 sulfatase-like hydrolase/transferase [Actinomarinicola tropica]